MSTAASKDVKRWCGNRHLSLIRPPVQRALLWSLPSFCFFSLARAEAVAEMCHNIADDLGASSCTEVLNENGKGFRLVGTLEQPLRFNDMGFDDNMVGLSAGSQNVCMLAAFGNGGVVPQNCVPIIGTQADEFNGSPEQHYIVATTSCPLPKAPPSVGVFRWGTAVSQMPTLTWASHHCTVTSR